MALMVVSEQVAFVENFDTGYKLKSLIQLDLAQAEQNSSVSALKHEFMTIPGIASVSLCSGSPLNGSWHSSTRYVDEDISVHEFFGDVDFLKTVGLSLSPGRNFAGDSSDANAVIVNDAFAKLLDVDDPLNYQLDIGDRRLRIIGVVENFTTESLMANAGKPSMIKRLMTSERSLFGSSLLIRTDESADPWSLLKVSLSSESSIHTQMDPFRQSWCPPSLVLCMLMSSPSANGFDGLR